MDSRPINDRPIHRFLVLTAIKLLRHWRPRHGSVLMISRRICIKYGRLTYLSEASSMLFISQHTRIPVPKVLCAFMHRDATYIVMERIQGDMIGVRWCDRGAESKTRLLSQLRALVQEMRLIPPPAGSGVANVDGGPLCDFRLPGPSSRFGPFTNVDDFHRYLRTGIESQPGLPSEIKQLIALHDRPFPLKFTHGDLSSLNVLIRDDRVVAIIDWETAGWYPAYWEYTTACQVNPQNYFWLDEVDKFLEPQPTELQMEKTRQKYFGDY